MAETTTIKTECSSLIAEVVVRKPSPDIASVNIKADKCEATVALGKSTEENPKNWEHVSRNWENI